MNNTTKIIGMAVCAAAFSLCWARPEPPPEGRDDDGMGERPPRPPDMRERGEFDGDGTADVARPGPGSFRKGPGREGRGAPPPDGEMRGEGPGERERGFHRRRRGRAGGDGADGKRHRGNRRTHRGDVPPPDEA